MSWDEVVKELREREALAFKMGGEEKLPGNMNSTNSPSVSESIPSPIAPATR